MLQVSEVTERLNSCLVPPLALAIRREMCAKSVSTFIFFFLFFVKVILLHCAVGKVYSRAQLLLHIAVTSRFENGEDPSEHS